MLGSKIVLSIKSLRDQGHESDVRRNSEDHPGPNIGRDFGHTETQETRRSDTDSDSDSNNNHDLVLDIIDDVESEADTSRMLRILQREKSRLHNVSRAKQSRASAGQKKRGGHQFPYYSY